MHCVSLICVTKRRTSNKYSSLQELDFIFFFLLFNIRFPEGLKFLLSAQLCLACIVENILGYFILSLYLKLFLICPN